MDNADKGPFSVVYLLTNPAMPGLVKIGRTSKDDAQTRLDQLYTTGVPVPFELVFACRVEDSSRVEQALHTAFAPQRVNSKREFFRIGPDQALAILQLLHIEDATQEVEQQPTTISAEELSAGKTFRARRPNIDFTELGIPIGDELKCTRNDVVVKVMSARKVLLGNVELYLTTATRQVLQLDSVGSAGRFWTYKGVTIDDLYKQVHGDLSE